MRVWLKKWLKVGTIIALTEGALWLLAERNLGVSALLRSAEWAIIVWLACGLMWIGLQYGQAYEERREQLRWIDEADKQRTGELGCYSAETIWARTAEQMEPPHPSESGRAFVSPFGGSGFRRRERTRN